MTLYKVNLKSYRDPWYGFLQGRCVTPVEGGSGEGGYVCDYHAIRGRVFQLLPEELTAVKPCPLCGMDEAVEDGLCFYCDFWLQKYELVLNDDPNFFIASSNAYYIGSPTGPQEGFGGRGFTIERDGGTVTTTNLWHNGEIPPYWRTFLRDNAKFV